MTKHTITITNGTIHASSKWTAIAHWCCSIMLLLLLAGPTTSLAYDVCQDDDSCAHEAMVRQTLDIFFPNDDDFPEALRREILFGAEDPDQTELFYNCGGVGGSLITCSHLWDADRSLGKPFNLIAGEPKFYANAFQVSQTLWTRALGAYAEGDVAKAYRYLGMAAHFLGDQTIPAHAHNDRHPAILGDGDYYEVTMSTPGSGPRFVGGQYAELNELETAAVASKGILLPPSYITETERKFLWLYLSTNQVADIFPSDDFNGDWNSPSDPNFPQAGSWMNVVLYDARQEMGETIASAIDKCNTDNIPRWEPDEFSEAALQQDGAKITECDGIDMFQTIREYSYVHGIRAMAGLFTLWKESIKLPILKLSVISLQEKGEGDDDTGLVDGTNDDDMYVGVVFGTNKKVYEQDCGAKGSPKYCQYQVSTFLEGKNGNRRKIDGAFVQSNTTRRDADPYPFHDGFADCKEHLRNDMCFDAEGKDYIKPLYRYGQVYDAGSDGMYDSGDQVEFRIYGWDSDNETPAFQLGSADDLLDIDPAGGSNALKFRVDLAKCLLDGGQGAGAMVISGSGGTYNCGEVILKEGTGGTDDDGEIIYNNNDTRIAFSVWFENILDDDDDGVPNIMDDCPDTPEGVPVSVRGCPNRAPVASNDGFIMLEDGVLNGNVITADNGDGIDSDEDGDGLSITSITEPVHGILIADPATGAFSYEPNDDYCGPDGFTYQLTDSPAITPPNMSSNTATVAIEVGCVNDPPIVTAVSAAVQEIKYSRVITPVIITVEDVDDATTLLTVSNLPSVLEPFLTLTLDSCTATSTESPEENGSTCTWVFAGSVSHAGLDLFDIIFIPSDDDGPGSVTGIFSLLVLPLPIPTLSPWALFLMGLLILWGVRSRLSRSSRG